MREANIPKSHHSTGPVALDSRGAWHSNEPTTSMVSTVHGVKRHIIKIKYGMKFSLTILAGGKNTISYQNMVVDMGIKISAESVESA